MINCQFLLPEHLANCNPLFTKLIIWDHAAQDYLRNLFFLAAISLWLDDLLTRNDLLRLSKIWDTVKLLFSLWKPEDGGLLLTGLLLFEVWLETLMVLTYWPLPLPPPISLMTSSSLSRQCSLTDSLCLKKSRELWLLLRDGNCISKVKNFEIIKMMKVRLRFND